VNHRVNPRNSYEEYAESLADNSAKVDELKKAEYKNQVDIERVKYRFRVLLGLSRTFVQKLGNEYTKKHGFKLRSLREDMEVVLGTHSQI
jgi:hypothetical protein